MKHFLVIFLAALLAGCAASRNTPTETTSSDSTYISARQLDSIIKSRTERDSIYVHDSVFITMHGDTVYKYVEKTNYRWRTRYDTLLQIRDIRDTAYINRTDTVKVYTPVEKPVKWYNRAFTWVGRLFCIAVVIWAVFLYIRRRK